MIRPYVRRQIRIASRRPIGVLGPSIARYFTARASNKLSQYMQGRTGTDKSQKHVKSGQGVTTQHDRRLVYIKRRMPYKRKKSWRRFKRKVNAVAEKDLGSRTIVFNRTLTDVNITAGQQSYRTLGLYGCNSSDSWLNDLSAIAASENVDANPTASSGITVEKSTKFLFQSGVLDLTIRNGCTRIVSTDPLTYENFGKIELDIYEMTMKTRATTSTTSYNNLGSLFSLNSSDTKGVGGASDEVDIGDRGATPFDLTYVLGRFGIKILKKTKFFIPNNDTITYQIRDPRRHTITQRAMADNGGFNKPGWTRILLVVYKSVPGYTVGETNVGDVQERIHIGMTRKYLYKLEGANDDRTKYVPNT